MANEKEGSQGKQGNPPSYESDLMEKESVTARIWKRRIAIIYVVLLLAVSATAIYFAIASARLESELQLKDANDLQNQAGSLEMRNKNDAENDAEREEQRLAVEAEEEESQDVEMGAGFRNDGPGIPSSHLRRLPGAPNDNDDNMMAKQITSIVEMAVSNCTFDDGWTFTTAYKKKASAKERMVAKNIHYNILPIANFLGIPSDPEDFKRKYENVASYLDCIMKKTLMNPDITELLHHISDYLPENEDTYNDDDDSEAKNHLYDHHKDDFTNEGYLDDPLPIAMPMIMIPDNSAHEPIKLNDGFSPPVGPFAQPSRRKPPNDKFDRPPVPIAMPMNIQEPFAQPMNVEPPFAMPMNFEPQIMEMNQEPMAMPMSTDGEDPFMAMPFAMPFEAIPMAMNLDPIEQS